MRRIGKLPNGCFVSGVWKWGTAQSLLEYSKGASTKRSKKEEEVLSESAEGSDLRRALSVHYVTSQSLLFLLSDFEFDFSLPDNVKFCDELGYYDEVGNDKKSAAEGVSSTLLHAFGEAAFAYLATPLARFEFSFCEYY